MIALSLIALWVLVVTARPMNLARAAIVLGMYVVLVGLLAIPLPRDFFNLAVPPPALLQATVVASISGCLAVEILGRIQSHVHACDEAHGGFRLYEEAAGRGIVEVAIPTPEDRAFNERTAVVSVLAPIQPPTGEISRLARFVLALLDTALAICSCGRVERPASEQVNRPQHTETG